MKLIIGIVVFLASGVVLASGGGYGGSGGSSYKPSYQKAQKQQPLKLNNTYKKKLEELQEADPDKYEELMELKRSYRQVDRQEFIEQLKSL